jgi:hypothetical protein
MGQIDRNRPRDGAVRGVISVYLPLSEQDSSSDHTFFTVLFAIVVDDAKHWLNLLLLMP